MSLTFESKRRTHVEEKEEGEEKKVKSDGTSMWILGITKT